MSIFKRKKTNILKNYINDDEYQYVNDLYKNTNNKNLLRKLEELKEQKELKENILDSLGNAVYPMYVLGGINLNYGNYHDKMDFVVITKYNLYVVNLDKEVHHHKEILKMIGYKNKKVVDRIIYDQLFARYYQEINYVNEKKTLLEIIKEKDKESRPKFSRGEAKKMANNLLKYHQDEVVYYDIVYKDYLDEFGNYITDNSNNNDKTIKELKKWCYKTANKEKKNVKQVLSDSLIKKIVELNPKNIDDLNNIKGFSQEKINKYGKQIIKIVNK